MHRSFSVVGSIDRIQATCKHKKVEWKDSYILHTTGKIKVTIDKKTTFTLEGNLVHGELLVRDIAVLALDQPYYPVTITEWENCAPCENPSF